MLVEKQKRGIFAPTKPKRPVRLGVRTADFHSVNRGSIPLRATKKTLNER
jgi:tRNA (Thr-GGU) A37 N-methylase